MMPQFNLGLLGRAPVMPSMMPAHGTMMPQMPAPQQGTMMWPGMGQPGMNLGMLGHAWGGQQSFMPPMWGGQPPAANFPGWGGMGGQQPSNGMQNLMQLSQMRQPQTPRY